MMITFSNKVSQPSELTLGKNEFYTFNSTFFPNLSDCLAWTALADYYVCSPHILNQFAK